MPTFLKALALLVSVATLVSAHGAPKSAAVLQARAAAVEENVNLVRACEQKLFRREHVEKRMRRREEFIHNHLKMKRLVEGRECGSTRLPRRTGILTFGVVTPNPNIFKREHALSERAVDCILAPEVTVGPYCKSFVPAQSH